MTKVRIDGWLKMCIRNAWRDILPEGAIIGSVQMTSDLLVKEWHIQRVEHYNPRHLPVPVNQSRYYRWYVNDDMWWSKGLYWARENGAPC